MGGPGKLQPGWYLDPSGHGQRYFDGGEWTDRWKPIEGTRPRPPRKAGGTLSALAIAILIVGAGTVLFVLAFAAIAGHPGNPSSSSPSASGSDGLLNDIISSCQQSVKKMLKDPDSAHFSDWTASEAGGTAITVHYTASGMVNAKNGFGGYTGNEPYVCDADVTDNGNDIHAQARTANDG